MSLLASIGSSLSGMMSSASGGNLPLGDWSGGWTNYSSGQSKLKDALKRQYAYAQSYAYNSPSWAVQGLRNAGLNPILAATDGSFSSPTLANPTMIGDGSGGSVSFSKMTQDENRRQEELRKSQLELNKKQGELLDAQADKARSDKLSSDVDTWNKAHNQGNNGELGAVVGSMSRLSSSSPKTLSDVQRFLYGRSMETGVHDTSHMSDSSPSSANYDDVVIPPSSRRENRFLNDGIRFHEDDPERFRSRSPSSSRSDSRRPNSSWKSRHPYFPWN